MAQMIKLTTMDEQTFEVECKVTDCSTTIKNILEDIGEVNQNAPPQDVPLPNVSGAILARVIAFMNHHHATKIENAAKKTDDGDAAKKTDDASWNAKFCDVDQSVLFELILAANYLDIKPMLDIACVTVVGMLKGKKPEEIRVMFNIKNDFTPEEEEAVRKENEWCEER